MLSTSQLKLSGTACHHITETPASFKSEITSRQLEDARESGCLHIKNCDMEFLPHLPEEITAITIENCNKLTGLTGLPVNIKSLSVINCENLKVSELPPTVRELHIELNNSSFVHTVPEGVEHLKLSHCQVSGVPDSVRSLELTGRAAETLTGVPSGLCSLSIRDYNPEYQVRIDNFISPSLQTLSLTGCSNIVLPEKLPKGMVSATIYTEQKTTWNIVAEGFPEEMDLDLQNVQLSPDVIKEKNITFQGYAMEAALHFRLGDIVYGLSEPRGKVVNTIKLVNDFSKKDILIQNTLTSAVWDYKSPRKYKKDALIKRALSESDRGINFKQYLKNHSQYNVTMADLSVCNRDKLWAKTSKAGLEFQLLVRNKMVHFCADGLVDTLKNIANKGDAYGQSITASELRWIYRNQDNEQIMKNIKFYLRGKEVPAEKILGMPEWKDYHPKRSGLISEYSK